MASMLSDRIPVLNIATNMSTTTSLQQQQQPSLAQFDLFDPTNASSTMSCGGQNVSDHYKEFYMMAQFITGLIVYPILCIIGITGNVLALVVLNHRDMRTSTNVYLSSLAVSDTFKLLNDAMYVIIVAISQSDQDLSEKFMSSLYPVAHYVFNMSVCVTSWLTVSVAVERYISVCYASRAKQLCTIPRARFVCTFVFIFMSILAIPSGLRYEMITIQDHTLNTTCVEIVPTTLGNNEAFMKPWSWIQNSLRGIIPVFILVYLNVRIINELRKERVKGKKFSARNRITLMLIVIVFMFLVCITPDAIMSTFFGKGYVEEDHLVKGIREITDSLLAVNSAFSFFLYCTMSVVFRTTFVKIFWPFPRKPGDGEAIQLTCTNASSTAAKKQQQQKQQQQQLQQNTATTADHVGLVNSSQVVRANGCSHAAEDGAGKEDYL
nr:APGWamide receptor 1 [Aplysia californica]